MIVTQEQELPEGWIATLLNMAFLTNRRMETTRKFAKVSLLIIFDHS